MKRVSYIQGAACLLALLTLALLCCLPVSAADAATADAATADAVSGRIYDPVDMLTAAEEAALQTRMDELSASAGVELYMATYEADGAYDDYIGNEYCRKIRDLKGTDAILLIVTFDRFDRRYYYDMYTYGEANYAISGKEVDYVLDRGDVYGNLKGGRIAEGAEAFFTWSTKAYEGRVGAPWAVVIAISAVIAVIIAVAVCAGVVASYRKTRASVDYPLEKYAKLTLTKENDHFVREFTTRTYVPRSSGSGGGSRHGGGGGHRGGR